MKTSSAPSRPRPRPACPRPRRPDMAKSIGTSIKRREDPRFIQGRGSYVANLVLPKMAYLAIKRSPYAHARIKKIDATRARNLWGVIDVFTGEDTKDLGNLP